ncbi:MAG: ATP-binding protein [Deltaproteobacteria bacterium]|nr:ATP-binding protein [Deltaproteobacteria bacterium]
METKRRVGIKNFIQQRGVSFSLVLSLFLVLAAILAITTYRDVQREKKYGFEILKNKAITLAFSLQASVRVNVQDISRDHIFLQNLIENASRDEEIAYIALVDEKNVILVRSQPDQTGKLLIPNLEKNRSIEKNKIQARFVRLPNGEEVFEIVEPFLFLRAPFFLSGYGILMPPPDLYWWVMGFKIQKTIFATSEARDRAISMAMILLVAGFLALYLLFTLQKYQVTRNTLINMASYTERVVNGIFSGLISVDREGKILTFNPAAERMTKMRREEVVGRNYEEVFGDSSESIIMQALRSGSTFHDVDLSRKTKGGEKIPLRISAFPLEGEGGKIMGAAEIIEDLREIKELEEKVRRSDRLASLGKFAAGIAHEVRNPLASIKGFAQYLREKFPSQNSKIEPANIIIEEAERLERIVSALLNFAKPQVLNIESADLNEVIKAALILIEDKAKENGVALIKVFNPQPPSIEIDKEKIKQVFVNLFINAIQEMEQGGTLRVITDTDFNQWVVVEVHDTGKGILPENIHRIFDPFFSTKESGIGLGLSIASGIIESHGGTIDVQSEIGKGTTFTIKLSTDKKKFA